MLRKLIIPSLILILFTSCTPPVAETPGPEISSSALVTTTSPISASTPLTILVLPSGTPQADADRYQTLVYDLAQARQMRFQVRNVLSAEDLAFEGPALKVVITLPPDPGLAALAAAAPGVQFLAVGISGLPTAANISSIGADGLPADRQAFLAGYIAGLVAPEWKVGILYQKDIPESDAVKYAFNNGFVFYCGYCRNPYFPQPAGIYPIEVGIPFDAPESDYRGHADLLIQTSVKVAFVYPAIATPDLLSYMAQSDMLLIGQTLPGEDVRPNWIASIQPDLISALQQIFPELVAGRGGQVVGTPMVLADVNPDRLSEAKLRLVQEVLTGLQNGTIGTGVNP